MIHLLKTVPLVMVEMMLANDETDTSIDFDMEVVECANGEQTSPDKSESSESDELKIVETVYLLPFGSLLLITFFKWCICLSLYSS